MLSDWLSDARILIVDDEPANVNLLTQLLAQSGYMNVLSTTDSLQVALLLASFQPDLILLDWLMPHLDGRGVLLQIRTLLPEGAYLPILVLTADITRSARQQALSNGAKDFLNKPFDLIEVMLRIRNLLETRYLHLELKRHIDALETEEEALRLSERRFRALIEHSADIVSLVDAHGVVTYTSPSTERILGYQLENYQHHSIYNIIHPEDATSSVPLLARNPGSSTTVTVRIQHYNGSWRWFELTSTNLLDDSAVQGVVLNYRDVTERKEADLKLQRSALYDALTDLPNRTLFTDRLDQAIRRIQRAPELRFAVLFLDLDRFKVVNDSLGHTVGDQLLIALAACLRQCLRPADTCARLGGDEFVILLEDIQDDTTVIQIADRIQDQLALPFNLHGHLVITSASIGIVPSSIGYEYAADILRDADIAMYRAKSQGKARHKIFDVSMRVQALERLSMEAEMRQALEQREFTVLYLPAVAMDTGILAGFEALVRWQHPERGLLTPDKFMMVAEETGLMAAIDWLVLAEACRQMREWQNRMPEAARLMISVNVSSKQLAMAELLDRVDAILHETQLHPTSLMLELTESALMDNRAAATPLLQRLRDRGIRTCIDDFGTGYSSLGYLAHFPIDYLKIDRRFVSQITVDENQTEIVSAIVTMARHLKMQPIAEGVETPIQQARLLELGCTYGQGYLFSGPVSSTQVPELIVGTLLPVV